MNKTVWVVESREYEARMIDGIYDSFESAVEGIKVLYCKPYIVRWEQDYGGLTGHFGEVPGYSCRHTCYFSITEFPVGGRDA